MTPKFPILSIYNDAVDILSDQAYLTKATVLGVLKGAENAIAFDGHGEKWSYRLISDKISDSFLTRLLANTVYNPVVDVQPKWSNKGLYELQELKNVLNDCIDRDDDIMTQFVDPEVFKSAISKSTSFSEICDVLNKYYLDADEDELWNEDESAN